MDETTGELKIPTQNKCHDVTKEGFNVTPPPCTQAGNTAPLTRAQGRMTEWWKCSPLFQKVDPMWVVVSPQSKGRIKEKQLNCQHNIFEAPSNPMNTALSNKNDNT